MITEKISVKIKKLMDDAIIPSCAYPGDAGYDLFAVESYILQPGERHLMRTGIAIELPPFTEAQVRPRSGYAYKYGITVLNSPGTIDQGYRNELGVILINLGQEPFYIEKGNRIAQLVIKPVYEITFIETKQLDETERGERGFGSSTQP